MNITLTQEEKEQIRAELKRQQTPHVYRRLMALKLYGEGQMSVHAIGEATGMNQSTINRIVHRFREKGMEAIVSKRHLHGKRYMSNEEESTFLSRFEEAANGGHIIEVKEIHQAYEDAVGHTVTRAAIYYILKKHHWRKVMPRSKHPQRASELEIAEYQKNLSQNTGRIPKPEQAARHVSGRGWIRTDQ